MSFKCMIAVGGKDGQSYRNLTQLAIAQILFILILILLTKGVNDNSLYQSRGANAQYAL